MIFIALANQFDRHWKTCRTAEEDKVLMLIAATSTDFSPKRKSRQDKSCLLSFQVVPTGIEPVSKV